MRKRAGGARIARTVAVLCFGFGLALALPSVAQAQTDCDAGHAGVPEACVTTTTGDPGTPREARDPQTRNTRSRTPGTQVLGIAFTGADVAGLAAIGLGATTVGTALTVVSRRRRRSHSQPSGSPDDR
ncbi:MAG: hypothetical protein ACRD29_23295 [Acidimicrobiales bacterium]